MLISTAIGAGILIPLLYVARPALVAADQLVLLSPTRACLAPALLAAVFGALFGAAASYRLTESCDLGGRFLFAIGLIGTLLLLGTASFAARFFMPPLAGGLLSFLLYAVGFMSTLVLAIRTLILS